MVRALGREGQQAQAAFEEEQGCSAGLWDNKSRIAAGWTQTKSHIQGRGKDRKSMESRGTCSLEISAGPRLHGKMQDWGVADGTRGEKKMM